MCIRDSPQNVYETALPITISDTIEADGVLLFDETCISGRDVYKRQEQNHCSVARKMMG